MNNFTKQQYFSKYFSKVYREVYSFSSLGLLTVVIHFFSSLKMKSLEIIILTFFLRNWYEFIYRSTHRNYIYTNTLYEQMRAEREVGVPLSKDKISNFLLLSKNLRIKKDFHTRKSCKIFVYECFLENIISVDFSQVRNENSYVLEKVLFMIALFVFQD